MVLFGQKWLYSGKAVIFGKCGCIRARIAVFGKSGSNGDKVVVFVVMGFPLLLKCQNKIFFRFKKLAATLRTQHSFWS